MNKKLLFHSLFCISVLFSACKNNDNKIKPGDAKKGGAPVISVEGFVVNTSAISDNLELSGTIIPNETTEIHPEISGRLTYLYVPEGSSVGAGALIGTIYDGDLRAQLKKLQVQLEMARKTAKRYEELVKINGVSRQEYDLQVLNINNIQADIAIVNSNLKRTRITAPFSGTLGLKMVSPGAYITPATVITTIRQNSQLKIDFTVPERYADKIKVGQMVNFLIDGNNKEYSAKVIASERGIELDNRSLQVRATVMNGDSRLLPGGFIKVRTNFDPDPNALMIPSGAIIPTARFKQVAIADKGIVRMQEVEIGLRDSARVQIVSGLKVGDTVITSGLMSVKEGSKIKISKVNQ